MERVEDSEKDQWVLVGIRTVSSSWDTRGIVLEREEAGTWNWDYGKVANIDNAEV